MRHIRSCRQKSAPMAYVTGYTYTVLTNQSATIAYVTACVRTRFNQSERDCSVRHGEYVRFSTNQSTALAYVTVCTYAVWPIRARYSNEGGPHNKYAQPPALPPAHPFAHPCTPLCTSLHTPLHIPLCTSLQTPLHIPAHP